MVFTGQHDRTIDDKGRLQIPSDVRSQIQRSLKLAEGDPVVLYVAPLRGDALSLYTETEFERRAEQLEQSAWEGDRVLEFELAMFPLSQRVELDRAGRIRLPEHLTTRAGLGKDVVLLGVKDHLEVRDRQAWESWVDRLLDEQPNVLVNPRTVLSARPAAGDHQGDG